jgi:hypothetical protein
LSSPALSHNVRAVNLGTEVGMKCSTHARSQKRDNWKLGLGITFDYDEDTTKNGRRSTERVKSISWNECEVPKAGGREGGRPSRESLGGDDVGEVGSDEDKVKSSTKVSLCNPSLPGRSKSPVRRPPSNLQNVV